jgi:hypothetical protein
MLFSKPKMSVIQWSSNRCKENVGGVGEIKTHNNAVEKPEGNRTFQELQSKCENIKIVSYIKSGRSQWPRGLGRRTAAARLLRSWVQIPPGTWMSVCCECNVLSGRVLCDELITHPEKSYRLWRVVVCDQETSWMRRPWPALGRTATKTKRKENVRIHMARDTVQWYEPADRVINFWAL